MASDKQRRHPCDVTADRLLDHLEKYPRQFNGSARDEIAHIRYLLQRIAEGYGSDEWGVER